VVGTRVRDRLGLRIKGRVRVKIYEGLGLGLEAGLR
jgi:hypothetical protein